MIKRLRVKLVLVITGTVLLIFGVVLLTLNLFVYNRSVRETENFMNMIAANDGLFLTQINGYPANTSSPYNDRGFNFDAMRAGRFFYVKVNEQGYVFESNYDMMFDFSDVDAAKYINEALDNGKTSGRIGNFSYLIEAKNYGEIIVFAERSVEMGVLSRLTDFSLISAGISCILLFGLSLLLSKWMVAPIKKTFDKQRRFISDANHELKTPLTIVSANVDILQKEVGDNDRFDHIRTQLIRMDKLIQHLLTLSKTEDANDGMVYARFDLSKAALSTALEFESRLFEEGREYEYDIQEDIFYTGDEEKLKSLLTILIDNAIQHSDEGSRIKVSLKTESSKPRLSVYNTGTGISDCEKDRIFDRFYRSDSSRARETGGYGLGLSIAKSIVDAHKGKIKVAGEYERWVEFIVTL